MRTGCQYLEMWRRKLCFRQGAVLAAALWVLLTPRPASAGIQIEVSPELATSERVQLVRDEIATVARRAPDLDCEVTIGASAFQAAVDRNDHRPIVATYLTSTEFRAVLGERSSGPDITAIFSNPDPLDQLALARALVNPAHVAVFDSPAVHTLIPPLNARGVTAIPVTANERIDQLLRSTDSFNVILALPDLSVLNRANIGHVVRTLYQEHKVLIGYSDTLVQIGSLASVYPRAEAIAEAVRAVLLELAAGRALPAPRFVSDVDLSLNERLARSLNIVLPEKSDLLNTLRSRREALR